MKNSNNNNNIINCTIAFLEVDIIYPSGAFFFFIVFQRKRPFCPPVFSFATLDVAMI